MAWEYTPWSNNVIGKAGTNLIKYVKFEKSLK
jgi:hypothetical protein